MKKIIAFVFLFGVLSSQAQVTFKPGIQAGLNLAKLTSTEMGTKPDFYIGGFGALRISKLYTLQPELTYSRQGGKGNQVVGTQTTYNPQTNMYTNSVVSADVNASLQYISAITINKFNFNENLYALVGPFFDILVADDFKTNPEGLERNFSKGQDIDLGIVAGFGYSFNKNIAIEARVKKGLTDAYINQYVYNDSTNNLVFQFGATYTFGK